MSDVAAIITLRFESARIALVMHASSDAERKHLALNSETVVQPLTRHPHLSLFSAGRVQGFIGHTVLLFASLRIGCFTSAKVHDIGRIRPCYRDIQKSI